MQLPFHVTCSLPGVGLYQLHDGRFQLIEPGPFAPFMWGPQYVLVEHALAEFLAELPLERVQYEPAVLFNRGTGEEFRTHVRLRIGQLFQASQLHDIALDGLRFLILDDRHCFASPDLKRLLESSAFKYLRFSEGLEGFAANRD